MLSCMELRSRQIIVRCFHFVATVRTYVSNVIRIACSLTATAGGDRYARFIFESLVLQRSRCSAR